MQVTSCLRYSSPVLLKELICTEAYIVFLRTHAHRNILSHPSPLHTVGFEMRPLPRREVPVNWRPLDAALAGAIAMGIEVAEAMAAWQLPAPQSRIVNVSCSVVNIIRSLSSLILLFPGLPQTSN